jgi:hypothetical protein
LLGHRQRRQVQAHRASLGLLRLLRPSGGGRRLLCSGRLVRGGRRRFLLARRRHILIHGCRRARRRRQRRCGLALTLALLLFLRAALCGAAEAGALLHLAGGDVGHHNARHRAVDTARRGLLAC